MALKSELMATGMPAAQAREIGFDPVTTYSAAGTTQATATSLSANFANVTTVAANSGVIITGRGMQFILNSGANVLTVYPPVGAKFNAGATNAGVQVAPGKNVLIIGAGTTFGANLSA